MLGVKPVQVGVLAPRLKSAPNPHGMDEKKDKNGRYHFLIVYKLNLNMRPKLLYDVDASVLL